MVNGFQVPGFQVPGFQHGGYADVGGEITVLRIKPDWSVPGPQPSPEVIRQIQMMMSPVATPPAGRLIDLDDWLLGDDDSDEFWLLRGWVQ